MDFDKKLEIFKQSLNSDVEEERFLELLTDEMVKHLMEVCNYSVPEFFIKTMEKLVNSGMGIDEAQIKTLHLLGVTYFSWGYATKDKLDRSELEDMLNS